MKTTMDLADDLAIALKKRTAAADISMRAAIHEAIRLWLKQQPSPSPAQPIPRNTGLMGGGGLTPEASGFSWDDLRALSYGPRG